jgi:hypothetical protein
MFEATLRKKFSRVIQNFGVFSSDFIVIRFDTSFL